MRSSYLIFVLLLILVAGLCTAGCTTSTPQAVPPATTPAIPVAAAPGNNPMVPAPDMKGTWISDDGTVYLLADGIQTMGAGKNTWVVTSQDGRVISGYKTFLQGGIPANQTFAGIFDPDGKTLSFIDQPGGWAKGTLTDADTLYIGMMNPGDKAKTSAAMAIAMTLHRQKTP